MATNKKNAPTFEQSLTDLESLVSKMEAGDLSLDESLTAFENGVKLTRDCQKMLDEKCENFEFILKFIFYSIF